MLAVLSFLDFPFVTSGYFQMVSFRKLKHLRHGIWSGTQYSVQIYAGHIQNIQKNVEDHTKVEDCLQSVQLLSCVQLFATWTAACQACLQKSPQTYLLKLDPPLPAKLGLSHCTNTPPPRTWEN